MIKGRKSIYIFSFLLLISVYLLSCSRSEQYSPAAATITATPAAKAKVLTVSQIANLDPGPERQKILQEGARAEGEMMYYTSQTGIEAVLTAFMRKYPFIKAEIFQANIPTLIERTRAEIAAGLPGGDLLGVGLSGFVPLSDFLTPFQSPAANFSVHPKGAINDLTLIVFAYNTRFVTATNVPQKLDDLLLPQWKGKIGFLEPPNTYPGLWTGMLMEMLGEDQATNFLKKLGEQDIFRYQMGGVGIQALISGEIHLAMHSSGSVVGAKKAKSPVDWVAFDPTWASVVLAGLFEKSPHPYSAMLFLDFMLGPEGQNIIRDEANYLSMSDIERGEAWGVKLPKRVRLETPEDQKNVKKWNDKFLELAIRKK